MREVCDHILIISKGRLVASDTPENLEKMLGEHNSVEIETGASPSEVRLILKNVPGIEMIETQEKDDGVTWARITEIEKMVRIKDVEHRLIKNLSKGYRQRVGLAHWRFIKEN